MYRTRYHKRRAAKFPALILEGNRRIPCVIANMSEAGAALRAERFIEPKTPVMLVCEKFDALNAMVIWSKDGVVGIKFREAPFQMQQKLSELLATLDHRELRTHATKGFSAFGRRKRASAR